MILIGGATGLLGKAVVSQMLARGAKGRFAVLARDAVKAKPYADQGIEVRIADFDTAESLPAAFDGIDRFLFISTMSQNRGPQQLGVVEAAARAGIRHIVYTGLAVRDIGSSAVRDLMGSHFETEQKIRNSGMEWTFLRNSMYAEAIPLILGPGALQNGIFLPGGTGRVPYALRAEMGEAAANLLLQDGHAGRTYEITGGSGAGYADIAAALTRLTGKDIKYQDISAESLRETLHATGMPDFMVWLTLGTLRDIRAGQYDLPSRDLEALLGRAPAGLDEMLRQVFDLRH